MFYAIVFKVYFGLFRPNLIGEVKPTPDPSQRGGEREVTHKDNLWEIHVQFMIINVLKNNEEYEKENIYDSSDRGD